MTELDDGWVQEGSVWRKTKGYRIVRTCSRCTGGLRQPYHHWAHLYRGAKKKFIRLTCCHCGHTWHGRYKKDEWDDE